MPPDTEDRTKPPASPDNAPGTNANPRLLPEIRLRPLAARDRDLVHRWLLDPEVRRWWGNAASATAEIRMAMESQAALCRLIETRDADWLPIGYAQAFELGQLSSRLPDGLDAGTWDCDVFIGSPAHRGRGFGQAALARLVDEIFGSTLAVACSISVSIRNESAARAYEKIGFRWVSIANDPIFGPSWVMRRDRRPWADGSIRRTDCISGAGKTPP